MDDFIAKSLPQLQQDLSSGKISCLQVVEFYLSQIQKHQNLNAYLEVFEEEAIQAAQFLDQKLKSGKPLGKLFGAVIGIKDVIHYKGHEVTASSKILKGYKALYHATVVEKILAADGIIIGRLNCDEFAMGSSNENSAYGVVRNAIDPNKVPGGSSGGSATAVKAGLCHAALGTDTGGSIRQPASFSGIVGFKPGYGTVSRWGLIAYASSFDQIGPMTRSISDAALLLEVIAGTDDYDSTATLHEVPNYSALLNQAAAPYRIAYLSQTINHNGLDLYIKQFAKNLFLKLTENGHSVSAADFPYLNYIVPTYYVLTTAEASSNLARFDGVRYGFRAPDADNMEEVYTLSRSQGFGSEVKRRIMLGTFVLSAGYYDAYYAKAQKIRRLIKDNATSILQENDFLITPTTPSTAFEIGAKSKDPIALYLEDIYTVQANLTGMPAISIPLGTHENGLPFGIQIMSNKGEEAKLLAFAQYLMNHFKEEKG